MNPQLQLGLGAVLIVFGLIYFYKAVVATARGRVAYWQGFLPFSVVSPWVVVLPSGEKSLIRNAEGLWVTCLMAPLFFISSFACIIAGSTFCGYPGADYVNLACHGGKDGAPFILFNTSSGFRFPVLDRAAPRLGKIFGKEVDSAHQVEYHQNTGSYSDAVRDGS
jgi:hypothetical protein